MKNARGLQYDRNEPPPRVLVWFAAEITLPFPSFLLSLSLSFSRLLRGVRLSLSFSLANAHRRTRFFAYSVARSLQFHRIGQFIEIKLPVAVIFGHISRAASQPATGSPLSGNYKNLVRLAI